MIQPQSVSLKRFNTFGVDAVAEHFWQCDNVEQLKAALEHCQQLSEKPLVLGGGSNLLFAGGCPRPVLRIGLKGVEWQLEGDQSVLVTAASGENWHQLVLDSIDKGFSGLENLALIPGTVGAAPIQNIGAYGVELEQRFVSLQAMHVNTGELRSFSHADCRFGYRSSIFKQMEFRDQWVITTVTLRLDRQFAHNLNYQPLQALMAELDHHELTARKVCEAVCAIRRSKLPDPATLGNAGSFFKNPVVDRAVYEQLLERFPHLVAYPHGEHHKLAAGWLIEQAGLKGIERGPAGVHRDQALVLVNLGGATGNDILELAREVRARVFERYQVWLEPEVRIIGASIN